MVEQAPAAIGGRARARTPTFRRGAGAGPLPPRLRSVGTVEGPGPDGRPRRLRGLSFLGAWHGRLPIGTIAQGRALTRSPKNTHILNGEAEDLYAECEAYESAIKAVGGIDLFLGGIGADGHIAFNEPGSSLKSRTRIKTLAYETILDNCRFFNNDLAAVPRMALTVGVATVMDAKEVVLIVTGANKALALSQMIEGGVCHMVTASALQTHPWSLVVCDEDATAELRVKTVKYFKSIEKVQNEVEAKYGEAGTWRMGVAKPTAA